MAGLTNADPSLRLSVDTPPPPIPKDLQGSDCSVPLSPQWLLPKTVDNKLGLVAKEPHPHLGKHTDPARALGNVEDLSVTEKRKDVFRPSFYDAEKGRRGHWGDEEREANSIIRRDSQREGEELGDSRKLERRANTGSRYSQEPRRFPSERGNDSGSRESAYEQRRESKWNTRWGPDDKESEKRREKWSGKDLESSHDKGVHHPAIHAKDISNQSKDAEKEGEQYRLWRSSLVANRVKGETSPYLSSTTHKSGPPMFGPGRGKGDSGGASSLSVGRGRVGLSASNASGGPARQFPLGTLSDRSSGGHRDPHNLRYSRMKLLDICRTTDLKGYRMSFEWFQEFPSLMQADPLMPLSLTAPSAEELFILEAIDKGDILSSGVPMASKDGSIGKNSVDSGLLLPTKSGIGEDTVPVMNDQRDEKSGHWTKDHSFYADKCLLEFDSKMPSGERLCQSQESSTAEAFKFETQPNKAYDSSKGEVGKVEDTIRGWPQLVGDRTESSDADGFNKHKEMAVEQKNKRADLSSYLVGDPHWQDSFNIKSDLRTEFQIRRQLSEKIEQEGEGFMQIHGQGDPFILRDRLTDRKSQSQQYSSPEHLSLFYKDPQGQIQGPFSGSNLIEWFDAGYFGTDLAVRPANAPVDAPFSSLGDVIPQLRTRVRPPPGFGSARQNDIAEASNRVKFGGPGVIHGGPSDFELMKNGQVLKNDSKVKAENQFLESLMSGRISSTLPDNYSFTEGMQGYNGLAGGRPLGINNTNDMKYTPQKMPLEQRSPLLSPYRAGRESPAILPKPDAMGEIPIPPKILPQIGEVPHHIPQALQHMDLLSILQSAADKTPPPPPIKSALPLWPNFPEVQSLKNTHGAMDISKDAFELLHNQQNSQSGFGTLPKRLQPQFPTSNQTPVGSLPSGLIPPEKLVASEYNQDVQMANILRQQYMLAQQFHSQLPLPTNLNQMELLLLMQRHQQEQQQNQLLMQQQQQQQQNFLSQPLSGYHSYKHNNEPSFSPLSAEVVHENASSKGSATRMHEAAAQSSHQIHVLDSNDSHASGLSSVSLRDIQEVSIDGDFDHLPSNLLNQFISPAPHSNVMDDPPLLDVQLMDVQLTHTSDVDDMVSIPNVVSPVEDNALEAFDLRSDSIDTGISEVSHELLQCDEILTVSCDPVRNISCSDRNEGILNSEPSVPEIISPGSISEQVPSGVPALKGVEDAEQSEFKKVSEKKPRKHKNSRLRAAAESRKASEKAATSQKSTTNSETGGVEKGLPMEATEPPFRAATMKSEGESHASSPMESLDSHGGLLPSGTSDKIIKADETKVKEGESVPPFSNSKAWKPVPGLKKTKPLSEIQMEEQLRAQTQSSAVDHIPEIIPANVSAAPLAGEYSVDAAQCDSLGKSISGNSENWQIPLNARKMSELPVVLDEDVLPKVSGGKGYNLCSEEKGASSFTLPEMGAEVEAAIDNDDFIEAKETRKSRKKAAKNKGVAAKVSLPNNSVVASVSAGGIELFKATRQMPEDKDLLPVPPAAPSLADFVFWKGDQASTVPAPAWSTDSVKLQKPASLRDIFKEQDKKITRKSGQQQTPMPTPTKVQPGKGSGGGSSTPLVSGSSPSKVSAPMNSNSAAPTQTSSLSSGQHKTGMEDDFFWGPLKQSKEGSRSDFPSLANSPSSHNAKATPVKGAQSEGSSKMPKASKPVEHSVTSSPVITRSLSKGKKDTESKLSEAMDFRNWCEREWLRLTGTNDISFLEFCLKQPTEEAAALLRENLVSLDQNHEFIDKFINYMEFLSSEIIEIAFRSQKSLKMSGEKEPRASHGGRIQRNADAEADDVVEASGKGKKKGKKGKKLSPSLLGFNVVSNRIMMGDIQTIEE